MPHNGRSSSVWLRMTVTCLSSAIPWRRFGPRDSYALMALLIRETRALSHSSGRLVYADDVFVIHLQRLGNLVFERFNSHG